MPLTKLMHTIIFMYSHHIQSFKQFRLHYIFYTMNVIAENVFIRMNDGHKYTANNCCDTQTV